MKKKSYIGICLFLALFLLGGCSNSKSRAEKVDNWAGIRHRGTVVVGLDDSFVPMDFRQKNGRLVGYDVDLARAVFKKCGLKPDFQTIDWSMKETELMNGTIDVIWNGYSKTSERMKKVAFSNPYLANDQVLVTKGRNVRTVADMKGRTIGVQSGSSGYDCYVEYPELLKRHVRKTIQYDTFNDAFLDLDAGRISGIVTDQVYASYVISHKSDPSSYHELSVGYPKEEFAVGIRKGDRTLRLKINRALKELKKDGTIKKIDHKWFGRNFVD
ncbi:amino acid ABC transporter substrate-binding protein [Ligilactobacillus sp.]|uniref:amino acid ABC transporter substrate-binding protein n=1 Tax=Ligilactobacillus sp. TaxID=2767921 RepID=UPI002FE3EB76